MDKYKKQINEIIKEYKEQNPEANIEFKDNYILDINGTKIEVSILDIKEPKEKDDEKANINKMQILFKTKDGYEVIAEVDENNEIIITNSEEKGIEKAGISDKINLKEQNKMELYEDTERDKNEEKDKERDNEEKPKLEKDDKDRSKEQEKTNKNKQLTRKSDWIKLDLSAEVVKGKKLGDLLKCNDGEAYIAPGKDIYDYSIVAGSKESGYHLLDTIERTEGRAPNQKIMSIENNGNMDVNEKQALVMFKCKGINDEGFTISKIGNGIGQERVEYYRKAGIDLYMSCPVPQDTVDRGVNKPNPKTKELMSKKYYSKIELGKKMEMHEEITGEVNKQNLPDNVNPASDGIQIEELDRETFRKKLIENIIVDIKGSEQSNNYEDYEKMLEEKAGIMADKILDKDMYYEQAKNEVFGSREPGGRTPDQKREREN